MKKNTVGYCWNCAEYTEHQVIECQDSALFKTFETIITIGISSLLPRKYNCKCKKCNKINTLEF